jgi:DNA polymerase-3 subunit epsilon
MKTTLFYDTETSGIPVWGKPSEDPCQPRVTQIAAELCEDDTDRVLAGMNFLIKPEGWTIPDDVAALNGITTELALQHGLPIKNVLPMFIAMWRRANFQRVAHNESFDMRMIRIELMRDPSCEVAFADEWKAAPAYDTCSNSTKIVNLPPTEKMLAAGRNNPKSPNLGEAFKFFTGRDLVDAHNAAADVMACKAIYYALRDYSAVAA